MEWVHIKQRVPEKDELILFYDEAAYEFNLGIYRDGVFLDNQWSVCDCVGYWMPLYPPHTK